MQHKKLQGSGWLISAKLVDFNQLECRGCMRCEGEVIDRRYRIARIGSTSVDVEDLLDSRRQTLTLQRD